MQIINLLHLSSRSELRAWLEANHEKERCCWVVTYRHKACYSIHRGGGRGSMFWLD